MRDATRFARRDTSSLSCLTSEELSVLEMAAMVGVATSTILSAMSASLVRSVAASAEAKTILTLEGSRCKNSSLRNALGSAPAPT